jgi:hypothetical protein
MHVAFLISRFGLFVFLGGEITKQNTEANQLWPLIYRNGSQAVEVTGESIKSLPK